jgi:uncharacterized membrane protein YqhA
MVMISGYENFVSAGYRRTQGKAQLAGHHGFVFIEDEGGGVHRGHFLHPLAADFHGRQNVDPEHLKWYVIIHMTFVVSAFAMGYLDKLTKH